MKRTVRICIFAGVLAVVTVWIVFLRIGLPGIGFVFGSILGDATDTNTAEAPLTVESIFRSAGPPDVQPDAGTVTLMATGDIIPARSVNYQSVVRSDFTWAEHVIAGMLSQADITFINLEAPLVAGCPVTTEGMVFCGDPRHVSGLAALGTDVASLGNNHAGNYGEDGVRQTAELLEQHGIAVTGTGGTAYLTVKGKTFAFVGFNAIGSSEKGIAWSSPQNVRRDIADARTHADVVVAAFHWGTEYVRMPTSHQIELAHLAVDAGADLVIGNHPHWVQPAEIYRGRVIMYAHGNTVFDQMWSEETKRGVIGVYRFTNGHLSAVSFVPIGIRDWGQAYLLTGSDRAAVLGTLEKASQRLAATE